MSISLRAKHLPQGSPWAWEPSTSQRGGWPCKQYQCHPSRRGWRRRKRNLTLSPKPTRNSKGEDYTPPPLATNDNEFSLSLVDHHHHQQHQTPPQQQSPTIDPIIVVVGPTLSFTPPPWLFNSMGLDLHFHLRLWIHLLSPPQPLPSNFLGFPQNLFSPPWNQFPKNQIQPNHSVFGDNSRRANKLRESLWWRTMRRRGIWWL